jgi:hypothetical protein
VENSSVTSLDIGDALSPFIHPHAEANLIAENELLSWERREIAVLNRTIVGDDLLAYGTM